MAGRLVQQRPGLDRTLAVAFLNDRMRTLLDRKPAWADLLRRTVISIPNQYTTGTINVNTGSTVVTGNATAWPVSDVVNTIGVELVPAPGDLWITPASMNGITRNTVLYVDGAGPNPEVIPVQNIVAGRVLLRFQYAHAAGFTMTASSLAGLQMRINQVTPIYTVNAVTSATSLIMDIPWAQIPQTNMGYQIILMYTPIAPDVKDVLLATDPFQQIEMRVHVSQSEVNLTDPNRTSTNSPIWLCDFGPNLCGNQLYEIYPPQVTAYQIYVLYYAQWPDMVLPGDRPPYFMNPSVLVYGALADAFLTIIQRGQMDKDPNFNPQAAQKYEAMFEQGILDCIMADDSKYQQTYQWNYAQMFGGSMGANWEQSHDYDAVGGNY